jgi:hypothetical protein
MSRRTHQHKHRIRDQKNLRIIHVHIYTEDEGDKNCFHIIAKLMDIYIYREMWKGVVYGLQVDIYMCLPGRHCSSSVLQTLFGYPPVT